MLIDSDISTMIFLGSAGCMVTGRTNWALYLVLAAMYAVLVERGVAPLHVQVKKPSECPARK